jgi:hypothetical protein
VARASTAGDGDRAAVEREVGVRGQRRGREAAQQPQPRHGERHADHAAGERQHGTLGQELAHEAAAPGAERGPHRELLAARDGARQERAGEVGARDEEDERRTRHEHQQRRARVADHRVAHGQGAHAGAGGVLRLLARDRLPDGGRLAAGRVDGDARPEPRDRAPVLPPVHAHRVAEVHAQVHREVEVDGADRADEVARQHADHAAGDPVEPHVGADDAGVAPVPPLPRPVREEHVGRRVAVGVVGAQGAPVRGRHTQGAEQLGLRPRHLDHARRAAGVEHRLARQRLEGGEALERATALADVADGADAERPAVAARGGEVAIEAYDAVGVGVGQRIEQHRLDDAEHRGVGADAQREGGNGEQREERRAPQGAQPVTQVLPEVVEPVAARRRALLGLEQRRAGGAHLVHVAEAGEGGGARRGRVHAAGHVLAHALLEVEGELVVHLGAGRGLERADAAAERPVAEGGEAHAHPAALGVGTAVGPAVVVIALVTAAASRCHPVLCSTSWVRPSGVSR